MAKAAKVGATIVDDYVRESHFQTIEAEAPSGHHFRSSSTAVVCASWFDPARGSKAEAWEAIFNDLSEGFEACEAGSAICREHDES